MNVRKKNNLLIVLLCLMTGLSSCNNKEDAFTEQPPVARVTLIPSIGGPGDNGYNDLILSGVIRFGQRTGTELSLVQPHSIDDARTVITKWMSRVSDEEVLLVLGGSDYEEIAKSECKSLDSKHRVLLFEADTAGMPQGVSTFSINRYGASYLAGCMAQKSSTAHIIMAMPGIDTNEKAAQGFRDGYETHASDARLVMHYLSSGVSGFAMPDSAFKLAAQMNEDFVFPLAGGSNNGIYKYAAGTLFVTMLVAGMDVDCAAQCKRVPFSLVVHIDSLVEQYLDNWNKGEGLPRYACYGLSSGFVDIVTTPTYFYNFDFNDLYEYYYFEKDYWSNLYKQYFDKAVKAEQNF